jgi:enoyl-CoA hydratase/carnithine racemase
MMETSTVLSKIENDVFFITLNMPETGNKIPQSVVTILGDLFEQASVNNDLKAVVINANGDHFCQGRDGGKKSTDGPPPTPLQLREKMMGPITKVYGAIRAIQVPVIAIVQGEANGFGAALAGSADITIAADNAKFSFPELLTDMPPTLAMATVMDRVGPKALSWLVYTNAFIPAQKACDIGLVSEVVALADLASSQEKLLTQLRARSIPALATVKDFLANTRLHDFVQAANYGKNSLALVLSSKQ